MVLAARDHQAAFTHYACAVYLGGKRRAKGERAQIFLSY